MTEEEREEKDEGAEPTEDESMADAFDFEVPEGDPDDVSDAGDEKEPAGDTGDDDAAAEEEDTETVEEPVQESIDPKLLVRVGRANLSDEETDRVLGLGNSEAIASVLDLLETRKGQTGGDGEPGEAEWYEIKDEAAEELAPELVEVLKSMSGSTRKAVEQMFGKYENRIEKMNKTLAGRDGDAFDDAVESLGKDWQPVFGKEGQTGSEHERNLERLRKAVFSDQYKGSVARKVKSAVKDMFAGHSNKIANDAKARKARDRQGRFIGKPAARKMSDADMSPRQRAVANAARFMKEHGMGPDHVGSLDMSEAL